MIEELANEVATMLGYSLDEARRSVRMEIARLWLAVGRLDRANELLAPVGGRLIPRPVARGTAN